jgi:hypothetical protein
MSPILQQQVRKKHFKIMTSPAPMGRYQTGHMCGSVANKYFMNESQRFTPPAKAISANGNLLISHRKERFAEVTENATYRGFNFVITLGDVDFHVRHYDDLPGVSTVIHPKTARQLPQIRPLAGYLVSALGSRKVLFYDDASDTYREADVRPLDNALLETCAA